MKTDTESMNENQVGKKKQRVKPFLCPCCETPFTTWWARYNHLQLIHRWENPPLGHKRWVDRKCTKNPTNEEIQKVLDDSAEGMNK